MRPARIRQPGPPPAERLVAVAARGRAFPVTLEAGAPLLETARRGLAAQGFAGGVLELRDVALAPFAYVMPALSQTPDHVAFYSQTFRPAHVTRLRAGAMTLGRRDGAAFFHTHALWREQDGALRGGHILPEETCVAETTTVEAFGLDGAIFEAVRDPETNFKLFEPVAAPPGAGLDAPRRAFALRLRPNEDFAGALEAFCLAQGVTRARIRGGVGSTIGAAFVDGRVVENFATEVYVADGVVDGDGARLDVGLVDYTGAVAEGRLTRGDNPVLMTFELVLEALD